MAFGWDDAIMAIPAVISLLQQGQQGANQRDAMGLQLQGLAEQRAIARKQLELATAGRTDARGNKTVYIPGQGWTVLPSAETASQISLNDELAKREMVRQMISGEAQRNRNAVTQVREAEAAEPLLTQFTKGYGAPTLEGVRGRRAVADVTSASENADRLQNAATSTALRTGASTIPLGTNLSSLNTGATAGIRSALASADAEADPMFQSMMRSWQGNKLDPYNMLATRASGETPYKPENLSSGADAALNSAAQMGAYAGARGSEGIARGYAAAGAAYPTQQPSYDLFALGIANMLKKGFGKRVNPQDTSGDWTTGAISDNPGVWEV